MLVSPLPLSLCLSNFFIVTLFRFWCLQIFNIQKALLFLVQTPVFDFLK